MVKTVGKYDLYGTLGEGAFGKVKYAVNTETNEAVAIKILDKDKIQARNMGAQIKKEISIMKMINHHHIVSVKDVFATSAKIFIVLEFVGGGELFDKIANEGKLPEDKARFYFKQLVEGLEHCHNHGVCHRDLKPENLLLDVDGNLKISDFGFSTLNIGDADGDGNARAELLHTTCGTPNYVAPEVLGKDGYDGKKADVWSCGVILYVLLAGYLPFDENTMAALFQKIKHADYEFPDWFSSEARDLISKILVPDPHKRPKINDLRSHPWMMRADSGPSPVNPPNLAAMQGAPPTVNTVPRGPPPASQPAAPVAQPVRETPPPAPVHHHAATTTPPIAPSNNSNHYTPPPAATTSHTQHRAPTPPVVDTHHGVNGSAHGSRPNSTAIPTPTPLSLGGDRMDDQYSSDKASILHTPHANSAPVKQPEPVHTAPAAVATPSVAPVAHHQQQQQAAAQPAPVANTSRALAATTNTNTNSPSKQQQQEVSAQNSNRHSNTPVTTPATSPTVPATNPAPAATPAAPAANTQPAQQPRNSTASNTPDDSHVVQSGGFLCCFGGSGSRQPPAGDNKKTNYNKV